MLQPSGNFCDPVILFQQVHVFLAFSLIDFLETCNLGFVFFGDLGAILNVFPLCFCLVLSNTCVCDEDGLCEEGGAQVCAEVSGSAAHQTMTECEVGLLRCRGKTVTLVSIRPCDKQSK